MPENSEGNIGDQINEILKGKKIMQGKKPATSLPLSRELLEILDAIGGVQNEAATALSIRNIIEAMQMSGEDACFCDRCSGKLGTQVRMVPTSNGPILEMVIACTGNVAGEDKESCDDQNISIPIYGSDEDEDEEESEG